MAPLIEEPDQATEPDQFLRGLVAGVALTLLAIAIVTGLVVAGAR